MKKLNFLIAAFMLLSITAIAQPGGGDMPPDGEAGACYAKCLIADQYEEITETVETKAAGVRTEVVPAQYETVTETVETKAASSRLEVVPATYELSLIHI